MNELEHLADTTRRAHAGNAWHGPSLGELLADVTPEQASKRIADCHTIWELTLHIIAWEDIVRRRLAGERLTDDNMSWEDNWPPVPNGTPENWIQTVRRADDANRELCESILKAGGNESILEKIVPGKDYTNAVMLHGAAQHVLYHAGQIALLKKLVNS